MNLFKQLLFKIYYYYNKYFLIQTGKSLIGDLLFRILGPVLIKTANGTNLICFINSSMDLSYLDTNNRSHNVTLEEITNLKDGNTFVDIGANIGYFSFFALKTVGQLGTVFAIEPSQREFVRLISAKKYNVNYNRLVAANIALSDSNAVSELFVSAKHTGLNQVGNYPNVISQKESVFTCSLDSIFNENQELHLVKIDVEGMEMAVLKGMQNFLSKGLVHKIIIEITPKFLEQYLVSKEELYSYLDNYGYHPKYCLETWQYDEIFTIKDKVEKNS